MCLYDPSSYFSVLNQLLAYSLRVLTQPLRQRLQVLYSVQRVESLKVKQTHVIGSVFTTFRYFVIKWKQALTMANVNSLLNRTFASRYLEFFASIRRLAGESFVYLYRLDLVARTIALNIIGEARSVFTAVLKDALFSICAAFLPMTFRHLCGNFVVPSM